MQAGPRICIGKDSAYLQMKMTTCLLLKFFSFKLVEGQSLKYSMMVVLYMAHGLKTSVSLRWDRDEHYIYSFFYIVWLSISHMASSNIRNYTWKYYIAFANCVYIKFKSKRCKYSLLLLLIFSDCYPKL